MPNNVTNSDSEPIPFLHADELMEEMEVILEANENGTTVSEGIEIVSKDSNIEIVQVDINSQR